MLKASPADSWIFISSAASRASNSFERPSEDAAVHGDARLLHAREDGHERELDRLEDAAERRAFGQARSERVREGEREADARREVPAPVVGRERRGGERRLAAQLLRGRDRLGRQVQDAARVAREVVRVEAGRHDIAREHRVEEPRGRRDPERVRREEEALGVVRDDGHLGKERRERPRSARVERECRRLAARDRDRCRERRGRPRTPRAALDVDGRAPRLRRRGDERVEAGGVGDPAHALGLGIRRGRGRFFE